MLYLVFITTGVIVVLLIIIFVQYGNIREYKNGFKRLSDVYNNSKTTHYDALINKIIHYKKHFMPAPSKKINDLLFNAVTPLFKDHKIFIHVTNDQFIAEKILTEGFKYSEDFYKTSTEISNDPVELAYKLQLYKGYGNYIIIICIPKGLYKAVRKQSALTDSDLLSEYGISEYNPDDELSYKLPPGFVKGYINIEKTLLIENTLFQH